MNYGDEEDPVVHGEDEKRAVPELPIGSFFSIN